MKQAITAAVFTLGLAGCASGGLSGAQLQPNLYAAPTDPGRPVAGIVGGGLIGGAVGAGLDRRERREALEAEYKALETAAAGESVEWSGGLGGASGHVIAAQPYRVGSQNCRQYTQTVGSAASAHTARGTACRNDDGTWTVLN